MRSIWKGAISFGLVTIPVKLYSATEEKNVAFHQVHREDGGRIRYKRVCSIDGDEVSYGDIGKGYELPSGETVILTDEDFEGLPLRTSRAIDVLQFVPLEEVDPIYFAKSYYLEPDKSGVKPYVLLRDALEQSGKVAVVKVALRQREQLATLRVRDGIFVLETMLWPDEVRAPEFGFLDEEVDVRPQELQMAGSLIETLSGEFDPDEYHDHYREALQEVIDAKVAGRDVVTPAAEKQETGAVVDLMAALRASVDAAKKGRTPSAADLPDEDEDDDEDSGGSGGTATKTATARKTTAKKSTAAKKTGTSTVKKAAAKSTGAKTPAKKAPAKRTRKTA
jgi:DNA end-binding protein Ku